MRWDYVYNKILWVSVGKRAAELQAIKFGGWKKKITNPAARPDLKKFVQPPNLMPCSSEALWPTYTNSTSLDRSKPHPKYTFCSRDWQGF